MGKVQNLQDVFLNAVRKEKVEVTVFLPHLKTRPANSELCPF